VAIELSAVGAGLPMAASFAMAGGFVALREGRRRSGLNAAMHELRRPLQALCLSLPAGAGVGQSLQSSLDLAVAAVERLDREINGERIRTEAVRLSVRPILEEAVERWLPVATVLGRPLDLLWSGDDAVLWGDRIALAQALDNLISNGLRHGSGRVVVKGRREGRVLWLSVGDRGCEEAAGDPRLLWGSLGGRRRHGHGLAIVRRAAAEHGGSFRLAVSDSGTEARLILPLGEERE
jgi:signal transduction histidine kinase